MILQLLLPRSLTTVALFTILSTNLPAADARFCDDYAKTAVKQQVGNIAQSCAEKGPLWSVSYLQHKAWCMGATENTPSEQTEVRSNALSSCGADSRKINWNTLPNIPIVWDRLFAQMLDAVTKGDVEAVKTMHTNGVSISHRSSANNRTLLEHAVDLQSEKIVNYLLSQTANLKAATPHSGSDVSLLLAAKKNDYTAVKMLLKAGSNPNFKHDETPLLYAIGNRNMSMIQLLIASGANPNLSNTTSPCLPLDKALNSGSRGIIEFLKSKGAKSAPNCR